MIASLLPALFLAGLLIAGVVIGYREGKRDGRSEEHNAWVDDRCGLGRHR